MIDKIFAGDSPVFRKLNTAVGQALQQQLTAAVTTGTTATDPNAPPSASQHTLRAVGIEVLHDDVRTVTEQVHKVVMATCAVAEGFYTGLLRQIRSGSA